MAGRLLQINNLSASKQPRSQKDSTSLLNQCYGTYACINANALIALVAQWVNLLTEMEPQSDGQSHVGADEDVSHMTHFDHLSDDESAQNQENAADGSMHNA